MSHRQSATTYGKRHAVQVNEIASITTKPESFTHTVSSNVSQALQRLRSEIEKSGGSFESDGESGSFTIDAQKIKGKYSVSGSDITITITHKPWPISMSFIKVKLTGYLDDAG